MFFFFLMSHDSRMQIALHGTSSHHLSLTKLLWTGNPNMYQQFHAVLKVLLFFLVEDHRLLCKFFCPVQTDKVYYVKLFFAHSTRGMSPRNIRQGLIVRINELTTSWAESNVHKNIPAEIINTEMYLENLYLKIRKNKQVG